MKGVLMIASHHLSAKGGVALLRTSSFVKFLIEFGWRPHLISMKRYMEKKENLSSVKIYYTKNLIPIGKSIADIGGLVDEAKVTKSVSLKLLIGKLFKPFNAKTFFIPDGDIGWIPHTIIKGKKIIENENIEVIFATCPSFSSAIAGVLLKKITKKPLIVDFRDAWTLDPNVRYTTKVHKWIDTHLESFVLKNLDHLITVTPGMMDEYISKYPYLKDKISLIYNGFDFDDFPEKEIKPFNKFTIIYTGNFYGLQSPELFFKGLRRIIDERTIPKDDIQVLLIGRKAKFVEELIDRYGLKDVVRYKDFVPVKEANEYLLKSQMPLLVIGDTHRRSHVLTGKVFQYLATGKPILALIPKRDAEILISTYSDNSYIITSQNVEEIANAIINCYKRWKEGINEEISEKNIEFKREFNRENQARELAEIFDLHTRKKIKVQ